MGKRGSRRQKETDRPKGGGRELKIKTVRKRVAGEIQVDSWKLEEGERQRQEGRGREIGQTWE